VSVHHNQFRGKPIARHDPWCTSSFVELEEITNTLEAFKSEVAAGAGTSYVGGRLIKKDGS